MTVTAPWLQGPNEFGRWPVHGAETSWASKRQEKCMGVFTHFVAVVCLFPFTNAPVSC